MFEKWKKRLKEGRLEILEKLFQEYAGEMDDKAIELGFHYDRSGVLMYNLWEGEGVIIVLDKTNIIPIYRLIVTIPDYRDINIPMIKITISEKDVRELIEISIHDNNAFDGYLHEMNKNLNIEWVHESPSQYLSEYKRLKKELKIPLTY